MHINSASVISFDLNVKKLLIQYGKIKVHWILLISA